MQHFGDITKIKGAEVPIVDVVTGGSPCQDLSVAGKRAGLAGERSGLFMEQIRVIKEMRDECKRLRPTRGADEYIRPRYMVWENVPGAFSSNKGEDFRAVLEETAKVAKGDARIPEPPNGRWPYAGCIMGNGWSIAWRLHDAQFWGVPQRRKRIALVADFGGATAPEILFEREGVSRDIEESREEGQGITANSKGCLNPASFTLKIRGGVDTDSSGKKAGKGPLVQTELSATLGVSQDQTLITRCLNPWDVQSKHVQPENGIAESLYAGECRGGGGESYVMQHFADVAACRNAQDGRLDTVTASKATFFTGTHQDGVAETLVATDYKDPQIVAYGVDAYNQSQSEEVAKSLNSAASDADHVPCVYRQKVDTQVAQDSGETCQSVVRRLTPLECERLQGFPDHWTDIGDWVDSKGKKHKGESDSPRYKALGNSIALPFWKWMAKRMRKYLGDKPTMASLFDGIGGFPLSYTEAGVEPVWASEIEEFPIAVTKIRFPSQEG